MECFPRSCSTGTLCSNRLWRDNNLPLNSTCPGSKATQALTSLLSSDYMDKTTKICLPIWVLLEKQHFGNSSGRSVCCTSLGICTVKIRFCSTPPHRLRAGFYCLRRRNASGFPLKKETKRGSKSVHWRFPPWAVENIHISLCYFFFYFPSLSFWSKSLSSESEMAVVVDQKSHLEGIWCSGINI